MERPYRLTVRTDPSHGSNRGSIPRKVTDANRLLAGFALSFFPLLLLPYQILSVTLVSE